MFASFDVVSMKTCPRHIEVMAYITEKGDFRPLLIRVKLEDGSIKVINIDKVIFKKKEKLAGNDIILFRCQSVIDGVERVFEVKYELCTCKWILFKM